MKQKIMLMLAFVLALNISAFAQQGQGGNRQRMSVEERVKATVEKMTTDLSLTKDQQVKLDSVYTASYKTMQKMREDAQASGGNFDRSAFEKLNTERDAKIKGILTADQYKKYEAQQAEMRQRMQNRGGGNGGGGGRGGN